MFNVFKFLEILWTFFQCRNWKIVENIIYIFKFTSLSCDCSGENRVVSFMHLVPYIEPSSPTWQMSWQIIKCSFVIESGSWKTSSEDIILASFGHWS